MKTKTKTPKEQFIFMHKNALKVMNLYIEAFRDTSEKRTSDAEIFGANAMVSSLMNVKNLIENTLQKHENYEN